MLSDWDSAGLRVRAVTRVSGKTSAPWSRMEESPQPSSSAAATLASAKGRSDIKERRGGEDGPVRRAAQLQVHCGGEERRESRPASGLSLLLMVLQQNLIPPH